MLIGLKNNMYKKEIKKMKFKKNGILYGILFSLVFLALFYYFAQRYNWINNNVLDGIYLFLVLIFFITIVTLKNKFGYYIYRYNYLLMLQEDLAPIKTNKAILSDHWQQEFIKDGFIIGADNSSFTIYYQVTDKTSVYKDFGKAFLCIVINKNPNLDLYGATIQEAIKKIYEKLEKTHSRLRKEIVVQFKEFEDFNEENKKELQKILNFKQDSFSLINLTVGFFPKTNQVYYLRPKKRFPNKYYYLTCKLIEKYI